MATELREIARIVETPLGMLTPREVFALVEFMSGATAEQLAELRLPDIRDT